MARAALIFAAAGTLAVFLTAQAALRLADHRFDGIAALLAQELTRSLESQGLDSVRAEVDYRSRRLPMAVRFYAMVDHQGRMLAGTHWPSDVPLLPGSHHARLPDGELARVRVFPVGEQALLLVGEPTPEYDSLVNLGFEAMAAVLALMLSVGMAAGLMIARAALGRLDEVNRTAETILAGDLSGRVAARGTGDEFDHLAANLNAMLDRIQTLVGTVRGVTHNIAHDLRTPLNRLRGRLEVALMAERSPAEYQQVLSRAIAEADGIIATFNAMLRIARIEGGSAQPVREAVDLGELAECLADLYQPLAEENGLSVVLRAGAGVRIVGDPHLVSQAVNNLVENAVKYTPPGGTVTIAAGLGPEGPFIQVRDTGPGVPEDMREAVLVRFTRLDAARTTPGSGLGLSLVAAVADLHGATLRLSDNHPGLVATLTFRRC